MRQNKRLPCGTDKNADYVCKLYIKVKKHMSYLINKICILKFIFENMLVGKTVKSKLVCLKLRTCFVFKNILKQSTYNFYLTKKI